jgi:hypothetical protein
MSSSVPSFSLNSPNSSMLGMSVGEGGDGMAAAGATHHGEGGG